MTILRIEEVDIDELAFKFEDSVIPVNGWVRELVTKIIVKFDDGILFEYDTDHRRVDNINKSHEKELNQIFKIAGLHDLNFDFTPNNTLNLKGDSRYYYLPNGTDAFLKKIETSVAYDGWFQKLFSCFGELLLIPDTNFLLNCYYSNYLRKIIQENKDHVSLALSRLTLFEIERRLNEFSAKIESCQDAIDKGKEAEVNRGLIERYKREKRLGFKVIGEIGEIIGDGGTMIPYNENLIKQFPRTSGIKFADASIRMEINDFARNTRFSDKPKEVIFLTSDLLNALMSIAENMNTIYIYNTGQINNKNLVTNNLIYTSTVFFEKCTIVIKSNNSTKEEKFVLNSMWEGKSPEEWANKKVDYVQI